MPFLQSYQYDRVELDDCPSDEEKQFYSAVKNCRLRDTHHESNGFKFYSDEDCNVWRVTVPQ